MIKILMIKNANKIALLFKLKNFKIIYLLSFF